MHASVALLYGSAMLQHTPECFAAHSYRNVMLSVRAIGSLLSQAMTAVYKLKRQSPESKALRIIKKLGCGSEVPSFVIVYMPTNVSSTCNCYQRYIIGQCAACSASRMYTRKTVLQLCLARAAHSAHELQ
jgi:hypothetical protein